MKKTFAKLITLCFCVLVLASCESGPKLLSIIPAYKGAAVTDTQHEFKNEDFFVIASYSDGTDEIVTDFEFEIKELDAGYYCILITYKDTDNMLYVPIEMDFYPSDSRETEHVHE